jgi:hypothetical protein
MVYWKKLARVLRFSSVSSVVAPFIPIDRRFGATQTGVYLGSTVTFTRYSPLLSGK